MKTLVHCAHIFTEGLRQSTQLLGSDNSAIITMQFCAVPISTKNTSGIESLLFFYFNEATIKQATVLAKLSAFDVETINF